MCVGLPFTLHTNLEAAVGNPAFLAEYMTADERPEWAWRYLGMIVEHTYLHEVAHAVRGHFLYLSRTSERSALDQRTAGPDQNFELDADLQAIEMGIAIAEKAGDFPKKNTLLLDFLFQKLLTLILLCQALDTDNEPLGRYRSDSHPPPVIRAMLVDRALRDTFPGRYGLSQREVDNVHSQAWWETSVAALAAKLTVNRWWGSSRRSMGGQTYARMVRHFLERFEPSLDRFVETLPDELV